MAWFWNIVFKSKSVYIVFFIVLLFFVINYFSVNIDLFDDKGYSFYSGCFSLFSATFLFAPVFAIFLSGNQKLFENNTFAIRFIKRKNLFLRRMLVLAYESLIFVLASNVIAILFIVAVLNSFSFAILNDIFFPIILQFLGYFLMGSIFIFGIYLFGKKYISFAVYISLIVFEYISYIGFLPFGLNIMTMSSFVFYEYILMHKRFDFILINMVSLIIKSLLINILSYYQLRKSDMLA